MSGIFIAVLNMSIAASVVALAVMAVRLPLKKAPKIFSYALWAVVFLRLACPFSFESAASLMPINAEVIPSSLVNASVLQINSGISALDTPANLFIENTIPQVASASHTSPVQIVLAVCSYIWLLGSILMLLHAAISYIRMKHKVYDATLVRDNIFETDKISTAFVLGFIRPKIYIPTIVKDQQIDFILKHEQIHIKRLDYLIKPFAFFILAVHWFNPLAWASYYLMSKDMEMSCDEAVLRQENVDIREAYSLSLVGLYTKKRTLLSPLAFGEDNIRNIKVRIKNVLKFKKTPKWAIVLCSFLLVIFTAGFTTNPPQNLKIENLISASQTSSEELKASIDSYYSAQSSRAFEMLKKKIFVTMIQNGWVSNLENIENPMWNYDSFASYQILDHNLASLTSYQELYCCTFSADNGRQGYIVVAYDGSSLHRINVVETPYLYDLKFCSDDVLSKLKETNIDLSTASASRVQLVGTKENQTSEAILFTDDKGTHYLYHFDDVSLVAASSAKTNISRTNRTDSLVQNFEKYKPFGVVYDSTQNAVYYNGKRVKLFVEFKSYKEDDMAYAFDLCYQDNTTDSLLYLEAVKDSNGNIVEIRKLNEKIAHDLLESMSEASPHEEETFNSADNTDAETFFLTMDGTQILDSYDIIAKDVTKDNVHESIKNWINECDKNMGAYTLKTSSPSGYTIYIYYNGGGRYPWNMSVDNDKITINLYNDLRLKTDDGYYLMYFTAPRDYTEINIYLDGKEIEII